MSHLGLGKSKRHHREADAPTMSDCLVRSLVRWLNWAIFFENKQGATVTVNGERYRAMLNEFLFPKIEEDGMTTFGFNKTRPLATQPT